MGKSNDFRHNAATSYNCKQCREKFKCKKTETKKGNMKK